MTAPVLPRTCEPTPESQDLAKLEAELDDPRWAAYRDEIQKSINRLRARAALEG